MITKKKSKVKTYRQWCDALDNEEWFTVLIEGDDGWNQYLQYVAQQEREIKLEKILKNKTKKICIRQVK